jgi:TPR repeat protein
MLSISQHLAKINYYSSQDIKKYFISINCDDIVKKLEKSKNDKSIHHVVFLGTYYHYILENFEEAKKYYEIAIQKENTFAMCNMGHCEEKMGNYNNAKKYYKMAVKCGYARAMFNLGSYYEEIKNDHEKARKYYLMAIKRGYVCAMINLASHYEECENYKKAKKYYLMAIEKGSTIAMCNLGIYYHYTEKNNDETKKYYLMAIEHGDVDAMYNLGIYYHYIEKTYEEAKKYYLMAIKNNNESAKIELEKLESKYNQKLFLDKIEEELKKQEDVCNKCMICCEALSNIQLINFRCNDKFDHYCCLNCAKKWYSENPLICIQCLTKINLNSAIFC